MSIIRISSPAGSSDSYLSYAATIRPTSWWRTTSWLVRWQNVTSWTPSRIPCTSRRPDLCPLRQVDLGDVAGHDHLRAEPEAGQEHLHLLGRRVLRLVEDDERVVQRAATHVRERRDLDGAGGQQPRYGVGVDHVVQRVVQGPQVRVDLVAERARQEAEPLPRLDRRPGQDDAVDAAGPAARPRPSPSRGTSCPYPPVRCRRPPCARRSRRRTASGSASSDGSSCRGWTGCSASAPRPDAAHRPPVSCRPRARRRRRTAPGRSAGSSPARSSPRPRGRPRPASRPASSRCPARGCPRRGPAPGSAGTRHGDRGR